MWSNEGNCGCRATKQQGGAASLIHYRWSILAPDELPRTLQSDTVGGRCGWLQPHILEGSHCPLCRAHLSRLSVQSTLFLRKHSAFCKNREPASPLVRLLWLGKYRGIVVGSLITSFTFTCVNERGAQPDILEMVMPAPALAGYRPDFLTCQSPQTTPWFLTSKWMQGHCRYTPQTRAAAKAYFHDLTIIFMTNQVFVYSTERSKNLWQMLTISQVTSSNWLFCQSKPQRSVIYHIKGWKAANPYI